MKSRWATTALALFLVVTAARAAKVDMRDPRRAVGREDDIRIDAEVAQDVITRNSKISVVYQVQNLTPSPIAIADKISDVTYDSDTQTITLAFGAEVPDSTTMPHLVVIASGEKKTFRGGGTPSVQLPSDRSPFTRVPRFVQIKVTVLRDLKPFIALIEQQDKSGAAAPALNNDAFDQWVDRVASVFLNPIPVRWDMRPNSSGVDASQAAPGADF